VDQAVQLIKILLDKGYAYWHANNIFYDPLKFEGFGKLFGLDMSRWPKKKRRFHKDTYPGQRWNLGDFILWHGGETNGIYWDTEIGRGRPAWNIQDAAMITKNLGFTIDMACGGVDNLFRHHDYTLAIIESVSDEAFSPYWLHGEHVQVNGAKMSKSRGNIIYLENLLEQGYPPEYIRFCLIYAHYRESLDLTEENLEKIAGKLVSFKEMVRQLTAVSPEKEKTSRECADLIESVEETFRQRMNDDLDSKGAFDGMRENLRRLMWMKNKGEFTAGDAATLRQTLEKIDSVFQVFGTQEFSGRE
jgi:cysteinyl-tRNA synthetase